MEGLGLCISPVVSQPLAMSSVKQALSMGPLGPNPLLPSSTCALSQAATWAPDQPVSASGEKALAQNVPLGQETMVMLQGQKAIQRKSLSPFKDTTTALSSEQRAQKIKTVANGRTFSRLPRWLR